MKKQVKLLRPNSECVWRDGARISYEIWEENHRLSTDFCLSPKLAWANAAVTIFQKSVTEISSNQHMQN